MCQYVKRLKEFNRGIRLFGFNIYLIQMLIMLIGKKVFKSYILAKIFKNYKKMTKNEIECWD